MSMVKVPRISDRIGGQGLPRGNRAGQLRLFGAGAVDALGSLGICEPIRTGVNIPTDPVYFLNRINTLPRPLWFFAVEHLGDMANRYLPVVQIRDSSSGKVTERPLFLPDSWFIGVHSEGCAIGDPYSRVLVTGRHVSQQDFSLIMV